MYHQREQHVSYQRKIAHLWIQIMRDCAPIRLCTVHVCLPRGKSVARLFYPIVLWLLGSEVRQRRLCTHSGNDSHEFSTKLTAYHLRTAALPKELGGSWTNKHLEDASFD